MEATAARTPDSLLTRDGALPVAPTPAQPGNDRHPIDGVAQCACCSRFPLVGEQVVRHESGDSDRWVCDRCEAAGRGSKLGPACGADRIRTLGGAMNVRRAV